MISPKHQPVLKTANINADHIHDLIKQRSFIKGYSYDNKTITQQGVEKNMTAIMNPLNMEEEYYWRE